MSRYSPAGNASGNCNRNSRLIIVSCGSSQSAVAAPRPLASGGAVRLGDKIARCIQQVIEDDVFPVRGRVSLPVKLERQFNTGPRN